MVHLGTHHPVSVLHDLLLCNFSEHLVLYNLNGQDLEIRTSRVNWIKSDLLSSILLSSAAAHVGPRDPGDEAQELARAQDRRHPRFMWPASLHVVGSATDELFSG